MELMANISGFAGAVLVLVAYYLLSMGKIRGDQPIYPVLNGLGSMGILGSLTVFWNLPSVVINSIWVLISVVALVRIYAKRRAA